MKPFALALVLVTIGWAPILFLDLLSGTNKGRFVGFAMVWGLGPAAILTFVAALLTIGGVAWIVMQCLRREE